MNKPTKDDLEIPPSFAWVVFFTLKGTKELWLWDSPFRRYCPNTYNTRSEARKRQECLRAHPSISRTLVKRIKVNYEVTP